MFGYEDELRDGIAELEKLLDASRTREAIAVEALENALTSLNESRHLSVAGPKEIIKEALERLK